MSVPALQGVKLTIGFLGGQQRYQWVMPYLADSPITAVLSLIEDFETWINGDLFPAWADVAPEACQMMGWQLEGLVIGSPVLPFRLNFALDTKPGTFPAPPTPPQTSMLIAFFSDEQQVIDERLREARTFVGPCPDSEQTAGVITDTSFQTDLRALAEVLKGFTGFTTGLTFTRGLGPTTADPTSWHTCQTAIPRTNLFTQRRRATPLL